ncbi:hypothetical protein BH20VER1_BH20VER1_20150 [soil metagenome]
MDLSRATLHDAARAVPEPTLPAESVSATDQLIFAADVNLITGTETHPKVTQDGGHTWVHGNTVVVVYNESRESPANYSGVSVSTDGGQTFTRLNPSPFVDLGSNFGTPTVFYSVRAARWFVSSLATNCGGQGFGQWESTNGTMWTNSGCVFSGTNADNLSMWVVRSELLLKVFFGAHAPVENTIQQIEAYREQQQELRDTFAAFEARLRDGESESPDTPYRLLTLRRGQMVTDARLRWCKEALRALADTSASR